MFDSSLVKWEKKISISSNQWHALLRVRYCFDNLPLYGRLGDCMMHLNDPFALDRPIRASNYHVSS